MSVTPNKVCTHPGCVGLNMKIKTDRATCLFCDGDLTDIYADYLGRLFGMDGSFAGPFGNPFGGGKR